MNIKEVEVRSGMPRSWVRYYESEGLLSPERLSNGYRDYSEADLDTLMRIKRLRELGLGVAEIRAVRSGEMSLTDALRASLGRLDEQRGDLSGAIAGCRALIASGAGWDSVLDEPVPERLAPEPPPQRSIRYPQRRTPGGLDWTRGLHTPGPWRRFLARWLDLWLASMLTSAILLLGGVNPANTPRFVSWLISSAALLILEPICLHFFAATPGKAALGVSVRAWDGDRLGLGEAFSRTWKVFVFGLGLNIPVVNLVTGGLAYRRELKDMDQPWDAEYGRWLPLYRERSTAKCAVFSVLCAAAAFGFAMLCALEALMPPNRGDVSAAEFAENYNYLTDFNGIYSDYYMTADGLAERSYGDNVIVITEGDTFAVLEPEFTLTEDGGVLTRVEFAQELTGEGEAQLIAPSSGNYLSLAVMSYVWGRPGAGALNVGARQEMLDYIAERRYEPFTAEWAGVNVTYSVEYSGFEHAGDYLVPLENAEEHSYVVRLTLEVPT